MSDMSYRWCKRCKQPEYACGCKKPDFEQHSPVNRKLADPNARIWEEEYFLHGRRPT
jgi:hypothetical protein